MKIWVKDNFWVYGKEWCILFCLCVDIDLLFVFFLIRGIVVFFFVLVIFVYNIYLNDICIYIYRLEMSKDNCLFVIKVSIFVKDIIMFYL